MRGGGRRGPGGSGQVAPGPLPAPHRATQLGPQFPQLLRSGAVPHQRHQDSAGISRDSLRGPRASCRLTQLRCWVVPGRDSSSSASSGRRVPSLHSAVEFNLAAIPPGTLDLPLRRQATKSLPGVQDTAVPAVGASCTHRCQEFRGFPVSTPSAGGNRQCQALRPRASYLQSSSGPFRPRPRRESAHPQRRSLPLFQGALRLPSTALQSPPTPTLPDTLRGHAPLASLVPRPMALADSQPPPTTRRTLPAAVRLPAP